MYNDMINYVRDYLYATDVLATQLEQQWLFRNRFEHTLRVLEWARQIAQVEQCDRDIVQIAAIFHDVGKGVTDDPRPHAAISADICAEYLRNINYDSQKSKRIINAVARHSHKTLPTLELSLEDRVVIDADMMDEMGALMVLWDAMDHGTSNNPSYEAAYEQILDSYHERKAKLSLLKTQEGKRLYQTRLKVIESFIEALEVELFILD